jgi:hypothetical protein
LKGKELIPPSEARRYGWPFLLVVDKIRRGIVGDGGL